MKTFSKVAAPVQEYTVQLISGNLEATDVLPLYRLVGQYGGRNVNVNDSSGKPNPTFVFRDATLAAQFEQEVKRLWPSIQTSNNWQTRYAAEEENIDTSPEGVAPIESPAITNLRGRGIEETLLMKLRRLARKHSNIMYRGHLDALWMDYFDATPEKQRIGMDEFFAQQGAPKNVNTVSYGGMDLEIAKMHVESQIDFVIKQMRPHPSSPSLGEFVKVHFKEDWAEPMKRGDATVFIAIEGRSGLGWMPVW